MNTFTKIIAGLSMAALAALTLSVPAHASGNNDWEDVGVSWWMEAGESERFDIPLQGGEYVEIYAEGRDGDVDLCIVFPDGYTICSDDYGDDVLTIDTEFGGNFDVYVKNADEWGTDFTLYVAYV